MGGQQHPSSTLGLRTRRARVDPVGKGDLRGDGEFAPRPCPGVLRSQIDRFLGDPRIEAGQFDRLLEREERVAQVVRQPQLFRRCECHSRSRGFGRHTVILSDARQYHKVHCKSCTGGGTTHDPTTRQTTAHLRNCGTTDGWSD